MPAEQQAVSNTVGTFRVFGVPVRLHFTFVLLFVFLVVFSIGETQPAPVGILYVTALAGSVLLHELGHAIATKLYGLRAVEVVIYPIGGVTRLAEPPQPRQELWIATAGPAANLLIALALFGGLYWDNALLPVEDLAQPTGANLIQRIAASNFILAAFNLLPAFPMDGGRILRSILALRRPGEEATRLAARLSQLLAIGIGLYGLLNTNFMVVFVAFFVYLGAAQESAAATGRILTQGVPVRAAMVTDFRTLAHGQTIRDAANLLLSTTQQDFPVLHGDQVIGLLGRSALMRAMATGGRDSYVSSAMNRVFPRLSPDEDLSGAIRPLAQSGACALVMDGERLVGLLTAENLSQFLLLRRFGMEPERLARSEQADV